ncbi:uL11 family ribosomal protein [Candidatus Carsonella ruddii]|uniref:Large ribosomal subunit protein uL11 n=1 Tax=Candidatus Carsonella ruddii HC isolate Thao2000 TaxID=1202538 RepID=J3YQ75_CARRU|nr:50S ribosomal protein L11 [Candidatus Carsonella ruddii]AFP84033.1 ribosomal protein L11 [Candidatus Carsonella ruddii HC isolate Thao2000]
MIIKCKLKLLLKPGKATPTPPIAPILGQYGINLMNFCTKFNNLSKNIKLEIIHVKIILFNNLNYEIILGNESLTKNIKNFLNIEKFSNKPKLENKHFIDFDKINIISLNRNNFEKKKISSVRKMVLGTLISVGINYE